MSVETSLRVKYGLSQQEPTSSQARQWGKRTRDYINGGLDPNVAGDKAARELFSSYNKYRYFAEGDTIHDLLRRLGA